MFRLLFAVSKACCPGCKSLINLMNLHLERCGRKVKFRFLDHHTNIWPIALPPSLPKGLRRDLFAEYEALFLHCCEEILKENDRRASTTSLDSRPDLFFAEEDEFSSFSQIRKGMFKPKISTK